MGTPVIGLTYDPKVEAMMQYIGQDLIQSVDAINPITLCRYVDKIIASRDTLTKQLQAVGEESRQRALENTRLLLELLDTCS